MRTARILLILALVLGFGLGSMPVVAGGEPPCAQCAHDADCDCGPSTGGICPAGSPGCTLPAIVARPALPAAPAMHAGIAAWAATPLTSLVLAPDTAPPKPSV
ncbi:MAG: hypothetical protein AMXMBFR72_27370 [Betaproteobacteria bacterium]|nr:MAG: hypothetical protein BroJett031_29300 [Betaproteobacteria bacterium]